MGDILLTKLISGDEIISECTVVNAEGVPVCVLTKPAQIGLVPNESGGVGLQMIPWLPFAKDHTVPIAADMILTQVEVEQDIINRYNAIFGSGIQVPDNKIQLIN